MELKEVNLYIDTSIRGPKRKAGAYGYVLEYKAAQGPVTRTKVEKTEYETTEHQSLCRALLEALKRINTQCRLVIYTDCEYIGSVFSNHWISEWYYNGWQTKKNTSVANAELWKEIEEIVRHLDVQVKVKEDHTYKEWLRREVEAAGD